MISGKINNEGKLGKMIGHTSLAMKLAFFYGYPLHHVAIGDFLKDIHPLY